MHIHFHCRIGKDLYAASLQLPVDCRQYLVARASLIVEQVMHLSIPNRNKNFDFLNHLQRMGDAEDHNFQLLLRVVEG